MKKEITYDELDAMLNRFDEAKHKCGAWWPTLEEIQTHIEPFIGDKPEIMEFALWISETADEPTTYLEKCSRAYLNELINENLHIKDRKDIPHDNDLC